MLLFLITLFIIFQLSPKEIPALHSPNICIEACIHEKLTNISISTKLS
jgi:hypothetical protein